jgi:hypothetical protein
VLNHEKGTERSTAYQRPGHKDQREASCGFGAGYQETESRMNIKIWQTFYRRMRMMVYGKMVKARFPDDRNLLAYLSEFHRDKGPKTAYIYASTDFVATSVLQMLGDSDCGHYFIESDFVNLVVAQATELPGNAILTASDYITPRGFVAFEKPILINGTEVSWLVWNFCGGVDVQTSNGRQLGLQNMTAVAFYTNNFHIDTGEPLGDYQTATIAEDSTCDGRIEVEEFHEDAFSEAAIYRRKVFFTLIALMNQHIALRKPVETDHRTRIEIAKAIKVGVNINEVQVVTLRRPENPHVPGTEAHREYQCQWAVRGHWRQQPYKTTGKIKPLFIESYIKGPVDKPMKAPSELIFVARR